MKVLVLGAGGMLGHRIYLQLRDKFDTWAVARAPLTQYANFKIFKAEKYIGGVHLEKDRAISAVLDKHSPDVIINCVGQTLRKIEPFSHSEVIRLNGLLPHEILDWARPRGARVIHFSTDCVFSGAGGPYHESSTPDARDIYGLSKLLGELNDPLAITIRSSIIGRELRHKTELVEWLISQRGKTVKGFANVYYSGVTTMYMAKIVEHILGLSKSVHGLFHLASPRISKFDLLMQLNQDLSLGITIQPDSSQHSDKSLVGNRLLNMLENVEAPGWRQMIAEMSAKNACYEDKSL